MADQPAGQPGFFGHLLATDDGAVDSIVFGGLAAQLALIAFTGYALYHDPASFNPINFGGASGALLAAIGGGRRLRDGNAPH